jgi:septum site-determining protein MinC
MSKIAIISRPDQGVLIDVGGCLTSNEAFDLLQSTLKVSSKFWTEPGIGLNFGDLLLTENDLNQLLKLVEDAQIKLTEVFSLNIETIDLLRRSAIPIGQGRPMTVLSIDSISDSAKGQGDELTENAQCELSNITIFENGSTEADKKPLMQEPASQPKKNSDAVLYLKQTLRAGQAVSHQGHLVIVGDVNAGAEVEAEGDITIWGSLRGIAHAGIAGNKGAEIRALKFAPIQIRIAKVIARSPDRNSFVHTSTTGPELAKLVGGKICISGNAID